MEVETAKILIEEEQATSSNLMDVVENLSEIPTQTSTSMKKKRQATQRKARKWIALRILEKKPAL